MDARMCRGYLGIFGSQIDDIAKEYTKLLTEHFGANGQNLQLKGGEHHITIASKPELQELRASGTLSNPSNDTKTVPGIAQLNGDLQRPSSCPIVYGLGTNRKGVYWVTVAWAVGQRFRSQLSLPPKHFHITLTSVDEHDIDKGPNSVVLVHPSYSFVRRILEQGYRDLVVPNQTEYLASLAYGLLAQNDLSLAHAAAELLAISAPTSSRSFVCLGDIAIQRGHWKLAMLCFGYGLELHLSDSANTDLKPDRISAYCFKQLRRSADHTDWGAIFVTTDDTADGEFGEVPENSALRSILCRPWPFSLRQQLQNVYANVEATRRPKRSLESRVRVSTLMMAPLTENARTLDLLAPDVDDAGTSRVHEIINRVKDLDIGGRSSHNPDLRPLSSHSSSQGHFYAPSLYTLPRFFCWVVPYYLALMSTPRNPEDIAALASPFIGIRHVVTLTEESPLPEHWFSQPSTANVRHTHIPVPNYKPPTLEQMDIVLRRIHEPGGSPVLIHCGGGKGRAGTVAACYLAAFGFVPMPTQDLSSDATPAMSANEAIAALRLMRPGSIETNHQEEFVKGWVSILWKRRRLLLPRTLEPPATSLFTDGNVDSNVDLLILCGLPGSGKSWFSQMVVRRGGFLGKYLESSRGTTPIWRIISQDESGSRATCETDIGRVGLPGSRAILDRCNPSSGERRIWLKLAPWAQHPVCVWFDYEPQLCIDRAQDRADHPTLPAGPRVRTAVASMKQSFQPPLDWRSEGFQGLARITSFEATVELGKLICSAALLKFPRTTHLLNLGAATSDDLVAESSAPTSLRAGEVVVITEKIDGANLGFSLSSSRELLVQNRSHYVNSKDHAQFRGLDSWISAHRESLYAVLDRDDAFPERFILYGEWMAATHSIPYTALRDLFYVFDLFDRSTNTFASRKVLEATLSSTNIMLTPVLHIDQLIPSKDALSHMVRQDSRFYPGPVEGVYVKVEDEFVVRKRGKVVRGDFIAGDEHWSKGMIRWNNVLASFP